MSAANDKVRIGGLMRCCMATISEYCADPSSPAGKEGDTLPCKWCRTVMRHDGLAWEWHAVVPATVESP
jgi:hypothetical protein